MTQHFDKFFYCLNWDVKYEHLDYDVVMKLLAHNGGMPGSFIISIFCQYSLGIFLHALFLKWKQNVLHNSKICKIIFNPGRKEQLHDQPAKTIINFYPMKTTGTGNYGVPAGRNCTIYGKGLQESQRNPMYVVDKPCNIYRLLGNPMISSQYIYYRVSWNNRKNLPLCIWAVLTLLI